MSNISSDVVVIKIVSTRSFPFQEEDNLISNGPSPPFSKRITIISI